MLYLDLMSWYKLCNDLTAGTDKYYSLTEYENMLPFERDIYLDMIIQRKQAGVKVKEDDVITDFAEI
jgi:hypothetical protein